MGEKKWEKKEEKTDENSGQYVIASSRPPERRLLERRTQKIDDPMEDLPHLHLQLDHPIIKAHVDNITPILLHGGPDPCVKQFLEHQCNSLDSFHSNLVTTSN